MLVDTRDVPMMVVVRTKTDLVSSQRKVSCYLLVYFMNIMLLVSFLIMRSSHFPLPCSLDAISVVGGGGPKTDEMKLSYRPLQV